jgi:hypothetical protein
MREFKDALSRAWQIKINVASIKRVRDLLKVDLPGLFDKKMAGLAELLNDPVQFVDVICALIRPELKAQDVSDESFGEQMGGAPLEAALDAFMEELIDFFPGAKASSLRKVMAEIRKGKTRILELADQESQSLDGVKVAEELVKALANRSKSSSGDVPALPASSPGS